MLLCLFDPPAWSQSIRREASGRLTVLADNTPLADLFRELSERGFIEAALLDPQVGDIRVTLDAKEVTPGRAIMAILEAADVSFTIQGARAKPFRVMVQPLGASEIGPPVPEPASSEKQARPELPLRRGEPPDRSHYEPSLSREKQEDAVPVTGAAGPAGQPELKAVGSTLFVLCAGLLLGTAIVNGSNRRRDR